MVDYKTDMEKEVKRLMVVREDLSKKAAEAQMVLNQWKQDLLGIEYQLGLLNQLLEPKQENIEKKSKKDNKNG